MQNGHVVSLHGSLRETAEDCGRLPKPASGVPQRKLVPHACDVREKLADRHQEYKHERPHSPLDSGTEAEFRATLNLDMSYLGMGYGDVDSEVRFPTFPRPR